MFDTVSSFNESEIKRFGYYSNGTKKLTALDLNPLSDFLAPYYFSLAARFVIAKIMVITPANAINIIRILMQLMAGITMSLLGTMVIRFMRFLLMMRE